MKSFIFAILFLTVVVVSLGGMKFLQIGALIQAGQSMQMPPTVVSTTQAKVQDWENLLSSVGDLEAVQGVGVAADLPGRVVKLEFTPGATVKKGDRLIQQDISLEQAQLRAAQASIALAKTTLDRNAELLKKNVISKAQFDTADANYKAAVAEADAISATIDKKTIRAPFDGRLGIRMVNLGQDLASGTPIVTLQTLDPIFVNFYLPQQNLSKLEMNHDVRITSDAVPGQTFTGKITAINPEVDRATRSVRVQATISNKDESLLPGMFAKIKVVSPNTQSVLAIPQTSVAYATFGDSVFVVTQETNEAGNTYQKATQQFVKLGRAYGDFVEVKAGISEGDEIVSAGAFKLFNGSPVKVNNDVQPDFKTDPTPEDT